MDMLGMSSSEAGWDMPAGLPDWLPDGNARRKANELLLSPKEVGPGQPGPAQPGSLPAIPGEKLMSCS